MRDDKGLVYLGEERWEWKVVHESRPLWFPPVDQQECFLRSEPISCYVGLTAHVLAHESHISYAKNAKSHVCYESNEINLNGDVCKACKYYLASELLQDRE